MRKLFFAICFSVMPLYFVQAKVTEIFHQQDIPQVQNIKQTAPETKVITKEELSDFLSERIKEIKIINKDEVDQRASDVQPSDEFLQAQQDNQKSIFENIYESALQRIDNKQLNDRQDIAWEEKNFQTSEQMQQWEDFDFPTLSVDIPTIGSTLKVPAVEHIPYLMSNIEVLPGGGVKITETITIVANGQKLAKGLSRVLPLYVYSKSGKSQKITYNLIGVFANEEPLPYKLEGGYKNVWIVPEKDYKIEPGIYTYRFEYLIDNLLINNGSTKDLYWDITGSKWNLVIVRSGATLTLPKDVTPLQHQMLLGGWGNFTLNDVIILNPSSQTWGYAAQRPLFSGESMHLVANIPASESISVNFTKRLFNYLNTYADLYISFLTLFVILGSFILSWRYIRKNKGQFKVSLPRTVQMIRYLVFGRYDIKSFGGFLLEMYRKNIIDIQQADSTILLVKRTDNLKSLSKYERKALNNLFTQNEPVLNVNKNNRLKIIRAAKVIEKELISSLRKFLLKINSGYLFFSIGMLLLGEFFISLMFMNHSFTFCTLFVGNLLVASGYGLIILKSGNKIFDILSKFIGTVLILFTILAWVAIISIFSAIFICLAIICIFYFTTYYTQRNGLLKYYIDEIAQQKAKLLKNKDNILIGREIANQQPMIWALDLESEFESSIPNEQNKLSAMTAFIKNQLK